MQPKWTNWEYMHRSRGLAFMLQHLYCKVRCFTADEWVRDPLHTWIQDLSRSSLSPRLLVLFLLMSSSWTCGLQRPKQSYFFNLLNVAQHTPTEASPLSP